MHEENPRIVRGLRLSKKIFDKRVDGEASSPARCRASNLRFEPSAVSPRAKPENPKGFQPPCHPLQFLLESFGFRPQKRQRNGFCSGKLNFPPQKPSRPRRSRRRGRWLFERAPALSSSPGVFRQPEKAGTLIGCRIVRSAARQQEEPGTARGCFVLLLGRIVPFLLRGLVVHCPHRTPETQEGST